MATTCLVPEDEVDIVTGNLLTPIAEEDIATSTLITAEAVVGLEPLGDCS